MMKLIWNKILKLIRNNNMNIIETYINLIKTSNYSDIKHNLEELNLSSYNIYYTSLENNKSYKIGKYGWCILCRRTANYFSDIIHFPVCSSGNTNFCETELFSSFTSRST